MSGCEQTSCGVKRPGSFKATDTSIRTAVTAWFTNPTAAEKEYCHIKTWDTSGVTDMSELFCTSYDGTFERCSYSNPGAELFNEDITAWDTSGVTSMNSMFFLVEAFNQSIGRWSVDKVTDMYSMFKGTEAFNQPLDAWNVNKVTDMRQIFHLAYSFNQDLGWCVDAEFDYGSFSGPRCDVGWSCGVNAPGTYPLTTACLNER